MSTLSITRPFLIIRNNKLFEFFVISVIIASALLVGVKTYEVSPTVYKFTLWLDFFITVFFVFEILIRWLAEPKKSNFFKNFWNVFDTVIVAVSLIPAEHTEMALIARLVRVFRVLRMISFIPELRILLTSLIKALPQLGYVMLLMFIIFYIYAAIGSTLFETINEELWGDITISLLTLFRVMTFEDWTDVMYETMTVYPLSWIYYITFIFFTAFAFLNMVIGIVVNVMEEEHAKAREEKHKEEQDAINAEHEDQMNAILMELREIKSKLEVQK
jgi:voltage-gated sodium channel